VGTEIDHFGSGNENEIENHFIEIRYSFKLLSTMITVPGTNRLNYYFLRESFWKKFLILLEGVSYLPRHNNQSPSAGSVQNA
jgi:hypothetical protein